MVFWLVPQASTYHGHSSILAYVISSNYKSNKKLPQLQRWRFDKSPIFGKYIGRPECSNWMYRLEGTISRASLKDENNNKTQRLVKASKAPILKSTRSAQQFSCFKLMSGVEGNWKADIRRGVHYCSQGIYLVSCHLFLRGSFVFFRHHPHWSWVPCAQYCAVICIQD